MSPWLLAATLWLMLGYQLVVQYETTKTVRLRWWETLICVLAGPLVWVGAIGTALAVALRKHHRNTTPKKRKETLH